MEVVWLCIIISFVVSVVTTKILATQYLGILDGYVKDMMELFKKTMEEIVLGRDRP